ncbi:MAG TPA: twin-arginine translocation signal domain-containing protein [Burkholderiales bacterium]|jgi:hypothetical protein|nr:twin-arginine translocation signal domain-containing protein [Burkholderiales bacterium]
MNSPQRKLSRRHFMLALGAGGATAAAALVTHDSADATKRPEVASTTKGYRLTEHVKKYYETVKV